MCFESANAIALFIESSLRLSAAFFQSERNGRMPLIGRGDFQSVVVHVVLRAS